MGLFKRKQPVSNNSILIPTTSRNVSQSIYSDLPDPLEHQLYNNLCHSIPIIGAAITKIIRLTGNYTVECSDHNMQKALDYFLSSVPIGVSGISIQSFTDVYLESLLMYGNALGEIVIDPKARCITSLYCAMPDRIIIHKGSKSGECQYFHRCSDSEKPVPVRHPERIMFTAMNPPPDGIYGVSILHGLPALSQILLRIYECIGQNYDRIGNVRYAVTYRPSNDPSERAYAGERAKIIAKEWSEGMKAGSRGEVRDFVCAGDVDIKVIGAENPLLNTEIPVRQLLEQIVSRLSIPPFLLGLNWSSTERMSTQQSDILTSELEYFRRLLTPVITKISSAFLRLSGSQADVQVTWDNINLQDETELALARLHNAQAMEIEKRIQ